MSIMEKLAYLKHKTGLTSEEIARQSGVPLGTVNKIASGQTRRPSCQAVDRISRVFRVPMRYLIDDSADPNCPIGIYAESLGISLVSDHEWAVLEQYRALTPADKCVINTYFDLLSQGPAPIPQGSGKTLRCYQPIALGQTGYYGDAFRFRQLFACSDPLTDEADIAIQLLDDSMSPAHPAGTVLALKHCPIRNNQLGAFLLNHEIHVRIYHECRNGRKLESVNRLHKDITLTDRDRLKCLGVVLGAIRNFDWLQADEPGR